MGDVVLPLELLAEEKRGLEDMKAGNYSLPPWLSDADVPRLIKESEAIVSSLEQHIAKYGNEWVDPSEWE